MHRIQVISTAQYSDWLAAKLLNLPLCSKVHARGELLVYVQCTARNVTFTTEVTQCGPQPRFANYTIGSNGYELTRYNPCFWTSGFVNFNGQSYIYSNNTWLPRRAHSIPQNRDPDLVFKYTDDNSFKLSTQNNPAYHTSAINHANVVADLVATITEYGARTDTKIVDISHVLVDPHESLNLSSLFHWFNSHFFKFLTVTSVLLLLLIPIIIYKGLCRCAYPWARNQLPLVRYTAPDQVAIDMPVR